MSWKWLQPSGFMVQVDVAASSGLIFRCRRARWTTFTNSKISSGIAPRVRRRRESAAAFFSQWPQRPVNYTTRATAVGLWFGVCLESDWRWLAARRRRRWARCWLRRRATIFPRRGRS